MKDSINLPIAIPAWALVSGIATLIFGAGIIYNQLNTLIEFSKTSNERITSLSNSQIGDHAAIGNLQQLTQSHEQRLTNVERAVLERK